MHRNPGAAEKFLVPLLQAVVPDREEARDIYSEILDRIHQCPLQKVSKWSVSCFLLAWWEQTQLVHLFFLVFLVFNLEPSMPGPISVCSLACGRTEELGRLQSITVALPLGGAAHGHPGAEPQTSLVLLHILSRKFSAPTGKYLVPFTVCALRFPRSPHAFQHPVCCMPVLPVHNDTVFLTCVLNTGQIQAAAICSLIYNLPRWEVFDALCSFLSIVDTTGCAESLLQEQFPPAAGQEQHAALCDMQ